MLQRATTWLADLPVGRKLLIGFGLICVLSLSAIGVGLYSASTLLASNRLGQDIATLNHWLLQARSAEKDYALTASQQRASQVRQQLGHIEQSLAILAPATDRNHAQGLKLIRQSSHDYLQQFEAFVRQQQQARQAQVVMQEQADEARIQFEFVAMDMFTLLREALINDTAINHQATLSFAEDSSTLIRMMLAIRNREFGFVHDGDNESLEQWEALMQGSENAVLRLHERINEENRDILLTAQQALASYRQAFEHYRSNREASQHSARQMEKMADTALEQAEQVLEQHQQQMLVQGRRIMSTLVISAIVIMLLSLLASFTIRQMILAPLRQVLAAAQRITSGDLSQDIGTDRRDEFGQLIQSMQGMTLNLRGLVQRIGKGIDQLNAAADQQQQVSQQSHESAQAQKYETDQAATAMEQMTTTVAEVARNAEEASQAARQTHHEAVCGDRLVSRGADQVSHLAAEVDSSMQAIQHLHQESERINGVLEVIKAVAEQTNLLALNAAIEAARAGEQGSGFAVVADEVRALARRTRQSTHEIEAMLQRLQNISNQAVTRMTGSVELNREAVAMTEEARQALSRITTAVSIIEQLNQQIAAAAEQQHTATTEVCRNVTHIRHIADESATAHQHMRQSSMQLAQLSNELQVLIRQFRTN